MPEALSGLGPPKDCQSQQQQQQHGAPFNSLMAVQKTLQSFSLTFKENNYKIFIINVARLQGGVQGG